MEKVKIEREKTIQEIAGEIFTKFGNTEMGRYKIQLMCDEYANECLQKQRNNLNKIVYEPQWIAKDSEKQYPHGFGIASVLVEFPNDADTVWCTEMCRKHLSNEEFECIGATPRTLISGMFSFEYPKNI